MEVQRLPSSASVAEAAGTIREHGYVIIDDLVSEAVIDQILAEMEPYLEATPFGHNAGLGFRTQRTGSLIARSPTVRDVAMNTLFLGIVRELLSHASMIQLSLTEIISLAPDAEAQFLHRDELLFDGYPFRNDYEITVNSLWALSEYTDEMGATRVVPGSHRAGADAQFGIEDTVVAEMTRGSVMVFSGKVFHGGGENRSDRVRRALDIGYTVGWVRQEENQYLSCPPEIAGTLPIELLRLMGFDHAHGYGHVGDRIDPLSALGLAPRTQGAS